MTTPTRLTAKERADIAVRVDSEDGHTIIIDTYDVAEHRSPERACAARDAIRNVLTTILLDHEHDLLALTFDKLPKRPVSYEQEGAARIWAATRNVYTELTNLVFLLDHARTERDQALAEAAWLRREEDIQRHIDEAVKKARHEGWRACRRECMKAARLRTVSPTAVELAVEAVPEDMPEGEP